MTDHSTQHPVVFQLSQEEGELIISICPGDGKMVVEKDGVDLLDISEISVAVS